MSNQSHSNNGKENSEDDDMIERNNKREEAASPIPTSASPYVYIDHSQERSEPLWFDQRFENLFQTADQKRKLPAKLNAMLSDPELSNIITWLPHGRSWRIIDRHNFINLVLPAYFDHNKFTSFIRLVNAWGFRRIPSGVDRDSYYHELFLRGMPHLHLRMRRLVSHESKAPVDDENRFPNFYEMPILDEVSNGSAPFSQRQNSASHYSISSINSRACPQSNSSRSEGNSSASTSTASAILSTGLPADQIQNQRQAVNSLGMACQAQQQLMSNSNNLAFHLTPGGNPIMQRNLTNALIAPQPYYASLAQSKYHQLPQQHQKQQGQQMNDSQSATYVGHHPYQANGSIDPAPGAIAAATNHVQLVHQQQPPAGIVRSVFVSGGGSNSFNNLDQVIPGTTQQQLQQQQILQVQLQQNLSSASSNQEMIMRQLFMQALNQHQQQEFDEAPSIVRRPHLSLSASQEQLNSSRSSAIVQAQPSSTVPTFLRGDISNSNGQETADYHGFITESNDCFTSRDSSTENSLSIFSPLARANSTVALNNAQRSSDEEAPDTSPNGNGGQLKDRWQR